MNMDFPAVMNTTYAVARENKASKKFRLVKNLYLIFANA